VPRHGPCHARSRPARRDDGPRRSRGSPYGAGRVRAVRTAGGEECATVDLHGDPFEAQPGDVTDAPAVARPARVPTELTSRSVSLGAHRAGGPPRQSLASVAHFVPGHAAANRCISVASPTAEGRITRHQRRADARRICSHVEPLHADRIHETRCSAVVGDPVAVSRRRIRSFPLADELLRAGTPGLIDRGVADPRAADRPIAEVGARMPVGRAIATVLQPEGASDGGVPVAVPRVGGALRTGPDVDALGRGSVAAKQRVRVSGVVGGAAQNGLDSDHRTPQIARVELPVVAQHVLCKSAQHHLTGRPADVGASRKGSGQRPGQADRRDGRIHQGHRRSGTMLPPTEAVTSQRRFDSTRTTGLPAPHDTNATIRAGFPQPSARRVRLRSALGVPRNPRGASSDEPAPPQRLFNAPGGRCRRRPNDTPSTPTRGRIASPGPR
jgi:hypothetical protein